MRQGNMGYLNKINAERSQMTQTTRPGTLPNPYDSRMTTVDNAVRVNDSLFKSEALTSPRSNVPSTQR